MVGLDRRLWEQMFWEYICDAIKLYEPFVKNISGKTRLAKANGLFFNETFILNLNGKIYIIFIGSFLHDKEHQKRFKLSVKETIQ